MSDVKQSCKRENTINTDDIILNYCTFISKMHIYGFAFRAN